MKKYKVKHTSIMHNGKVRSEGSIIELDDNQAKRLEDFVELVPEQKTSAPAKETKTQTTTTKSNNKKSAAKTAETKTETKPETVETQDETKDGEVVDGGDADGK